MSVQIEPASSERHTLPSSVPAKYTDPLTGEIAKVVRVP